MLVFACVQMYVSGVVMVCWRVDARVCIHEMMCVMYVL